MDMMKNQIFSYLKSQRSPVGLKRLERTLRLPASERAYLKALLKDMVQDGQLIRTRDSLYAVSTRSGNPMPMPSLPYRSIRDAFVGQTAAGLSYRDSRTGRNWQVHWAADMHGRVETGDRVLLLDRGGRKGQILGIVERSPSWAYFTPGNHKDTRCPTDWNPILREAFTLFSPWEKEMPFTPDHEEMKGRVNICHLPVFRPWNRENESPVMLSCQQHRNQYTLGFHLLDMTACIRLGSELDTGALLRGTSGTSSASVSPMLPHFSSAGPLPAISLFLDMNRNGSLSPWRLELNMVQPQHDYHPGTGEPFNLHDIPTLAPLERILRPASDSNRDWLAAACIFVDTMLTRVMLERGINGLQWRHDGDMPEYLAFHKGNRYRHAPVRFTDPINRYADTVNHRMLKSWLRREPAPCSMGQLEMLAAACSWREAVTRQAESGDRLMSHIHRLISRKKEHVTVRFTGQDQQGYCVILGDGKEPGIVPIHLLSRDIPLAGASREIPVSWVQPVLSVNKLPSLDLRL